VTDDIIDELTWRGLIALSTDVDDLRRALAAGPVTLYGGFDPTAAGMCVGTDHNDLSKQSCMERQQGLARPTADGTSRCRPESASRLISPNLMGPDPWRPPDPGVFGARRRG